MPDSLSHSKTFCFVGGASEEHPLIVVDAASTRPGVPSYHFWSLALNPLRATPLLHAGSIKKSIILEFVSTLFLSDLHRDRSLEALEEIFSTGTILPEEHAANIFSLLDDQYDVLHQDHTNRVQLIFLALQSFREARQ
jgi:hypothetical protein